MDDEIDKKMKDAASNARWLCFAVEYVFAIVLYIAIKAACGLAYAELYMCIVLAIALCASTGSASKMLVDGIASSNKTGENNEIDGSKEKEASQQEDKGNSKG